MITNYIINQNTILNVVQKIKFLEHFLSVFIFPIYRIDIDSLK